MPSNPPSRSPELLSPADSGVLVVDVQEKLVGLIPDHRRIVWNIRRLLDGAKLLHVFATATEQYPQGLGPTSAELSDRLGVIPAKTMFSCRGCPETFAALHDRAIEKVLLVGIESHVCVLQTAFDLLADGFRVFVAVDATGSRHAIDHDIAMRRMESAGATLTTTEGAIFEWCETASAPQFKEVSKLVRESPPA